MVEIKQIKPSRNNLLKFIKFQLALYKDNKYFVPPLIIDELDTLNPDKNPAFDFCDGAYFMAYRNEKPVGRIAAIENKQINERCKQKIARFGFFDFIDDQEVSSALLAAAEQWARDRGLTRIVGPLGFTDLDREGMLTFGYDELSTMATNYNYPYYVDHIEKAGYVKDSDWVEFQIAIPEGVPERYKRISDIVAKKYGLKVLKYSSRKKIREEYGHEIFTLVNEAYKDLYQYSLLTERQIKKYIKEYINLLDLDLVTLIADAQGTLQGIGIAMPSMSRALQKSGGKLFPTGWLPLLKGLKGKNDRVDLLLVGIRPEYQGKGVNALLFTDLIPQFIKHGYKLAESNPEMETNAKVQNQWDAFNPRLHRRRRSFCKDL